MTGCGKEMVPTESSETAVIKETIQITKKVQPTITETEPEIEVLSPFDNPKGLSKQNLLEAVQFLYKELESRCDINSL